MRLFFAVLILLSSCSLETPVSLTLTIAEQHPFEELYGMYLWYELSYFDGEEIIVKHIPSGIRDINVSVKAGGLRVFTLRPLGELSPIGGFFEPGQGRVVYMKGENGAFADILLSASSYRPDAVSRLSMEKVREAEPDIARIDEVAFLTSLFDGSLTATTIKRQEKSLVGFDSIPEGEWTSERYEVPSFEVEMSGDEVIFNIYPGVYRYISKSRELLLTVILTEEGEASATIRQSPIL